MGAHKNVDGAIEQTFKNLFTTFAFYDTCKQGHSKVHIFQKSHDGLKMLLCKYLRWCHDTGLIAIVYS